MNTIAIIGAGIGGLVAGNLLARKGHKVTIFESHSTPGGYTAGFWKKGFYFESGTISFESSEGVFKAMKDIGVYSKIPFVRQRTRWITPDFDAMLDSIDDWKKVLLETYPSEKEKLLRYNKEIDKMVGAMRGTGPPKNLFGMITFPFKILRFIRMVKKYEKITLPEFTAKYFEKDSRLYHLLKRVGYPDMSAGLLGAALLAFLEDYWTVQTGMQSWADVLAENLKDLGGELRLNSYVDKIITQNGKAIGVSCKGTEYRSDYVISACDYKKTFLKLLDAPSVLPLGFNDKVENAEVSEPFFAVYLGLNLPQEKIKGYMRGSHVMYNDFQPDLNIHNSNDEKHFEKTPMLLFSPSLMNAALAPEGKSSLMLEAMTPKKWMNNWGGGDKSEYKRLKERAKKALIKQASIVIPDLKKYIEFEDAATPHTYECYTHNTDGASSAWSWNPHKAFYTKFGTKVDTPVKNLLISSCWSTQYGGVPSSIMAAYRCAKKIK